MNNGTLLESITQEVLTYFAASDQPCDAITLEMVRARDDDNRRVRRARKALCIVLRENGEGMTIPDIAAYIARDCKTVYYHQHDLAMIVVMGGMDAAEWERDLRNITGRLLKYGGYEDATGGDTESSVESTQDRDAPREQAPGSCLAPPCDSSRFDRRSLPRSTATFGGARLEYEQAAAGDRVSVVDRTRGRNRTRRDP